MYPTGFGRPELTVRMTEEAERLGFDSVWGNDHITTQRYLRNLSPKPGFYEPLIVISYLAAVTERIALGTGVIVAPLRNPVVLAKQAATLDHISKGRFILGLGIGAYREEFESVGGAGRRGHILDETVQGLRLLFHQPSATFQGKYVRFSEVELNPKPLQRPFPLWLAGNSPDGIKRVGLMGDGWLPAVLTPEEVRSGILEIRASARGAGRDPSKIEIAPEYGCSIASDRSEARRRFVESPMFEHLRSLKTSTLQGVGSFDMEALVSRNFVGTPDEIIRKLEVYKEAGVTHIWFDFLGRSLEEVLHGMKKFSQEVIPSFKG